MSTRVVFANGTNPMAQAGKRPLNVVPRRPCFSWIARKIVRPIVLLTAALLCQACALNYIDSGGDRHTIGLVDITVHPPAAPETFAGDVVEVTALGLILSETAQGGYVALCYSHEATAALRDNALVLGNPARPLAPFGQARKGPP